MAALGFSILFLGASNLCRAQIEQSTMILNGKLTVDAAGNGHLEADIKFNPPRIYDRIKRAYPNLYVLFRDLIANDRASSEIDRSKTKINADDGTQTISFAASASGVAVNRSGKWQIPLAQGESLVTSEGNKVITSLVSATQNGMILNGTGVYSLPAGAHDVNFDKENRRLSYALSSATGAKGKSAGQPEIDLAIRCRKSVMSAVYKLYADPEVANGRYWVAKTVVRNTGTAPMRDVKIRYGLGEYASSFSSQPYTVIMPQGAVVDCYYPLFSSKVAELKTRTPMELSVNVSYKDAAGNIHTEERTERLSMLGINQFEFSNLSEDEKTDSWFDKNNNGPLLAAYVTKMDDPVKQLAGYISEAAGGVAAAGKPEDALKWMRAAYNMELLNNIVYQTPSSEDFGQDIKYPRDVLRAKSGTCVDLAILYASLAESVGLHAFLMLVPGHCFSIVSVGGQIIPVENTGLGGGANRASFDQVVQYAQKELQQYMQQGLYYLIDIDAQQGPGHIPNPELPTLESNFLDTCGIKRTGVITETAPPPQTVGGGNDRGTRPDATTALPSQPDGGNDRGARSDTTGPDTATLVGAAKDFNGVWKGDIDGARLTLMLNQTDNNVDGSLIVNGNYTVRGSFKKGTVTEANTINLHVRATGGGRIYSASLEGKRDGNTIKGSGTVILRSILGVPLDTRTVSWVAHYSGTR
jgi:hypothetical protein